MTDQQEPAEAAEGRSAQDEKASFEAPRRNPPEELAEDIGRLPGDKPATDPLLGGGVSERTHSTGEHPTPSEGEQAAEK